MRGMREALLGLAIAAAASAPLAAQTLVPMTTGVVPVVASLPGEMASHWSTSVYIRQLSGEAPAQVTMTIHDPAGPDWIVAMALSDPHGSAEVPDVVAAAGSGVPPGKYVMTWWSTQPIILTTRTFTTAPGGTVGQGTGSVAPGSGFGMGGSVAFPAPMDSATARVNLGLANASDFAQIFTVDAVDGGGGLVRSWEKTVEPWAVMQFRTNDGFSAAGSVTVRCTQGCNGNGFAYTSVVLNGTNDAFFMYAAAGAGEAEVAPVATVRDAKGVWFITGGTVYDVFEAMGYAVASDRLWQAELFRRQARGTLAEIFGPDYLSTDVLVRTMSHSEAELARAYAGLDTDGKTMIKGYADGFNRRIAELRQDPSQLPFEFKAVGAQLGTLFIPADWTPTDILAWAALLQRNFDPEALHTGQLDNAVLMQELSAVYPSEGQGMFADLRWLNDPAAQTVIPKPVEEQHLPMAEVAARPPALPDLSQADAHIKARLADQVDKLQRLGARVKMGSYAWVVSGTKTASGNPIIYSGPQMGFTAPAITLEGSIHGGGLDISGMTIAGIPGIIIGRTPHHAWSMQVGHAHTTDYYIEPPSAVHLDRVETINVAGATPVTLPIYRTIHGPVVEPIPFDPNNPASPIVSWKYAQWDAELHWTDFAFGVARATSVAQFGAAIENLGVSQHFCYADRDGNISYWMSGIDPVRAPNADPRFPQLGDGSQEWPQPLQRKRQAHDENTAQGYYGGWNNKSAAFYANSTQNLGYAFGPAHRAHVIKEYLDTHNNLTYEQVRDLALFIATTDSFGGGGNPWEFVASRFAAAVEADSTPEREAALALLADWDGHFVAGGPSEWVAGMTRADAWVLQDAWIREVLRLTFDDELSAAGVTLQSQTLPILFNVFLHALAGPESSIVNHIDWFQDRSNSGKPTTADGIIVLALDNVLQQLGPRPWNRPRGLITYSHTLLGQLSTTPFASRSTYAHCVEFSSQGPMRLESMFPLGESGTILGDPRTGPQFDPNFFSMKPVFDAFAPRPFPLPQ